MTSKQALEKLDNTLCLNSQSLRFNIDTEDNIDCKDVDEMIECLETVERDLDVLEVIIKKDVEIKYVKMAIEAEKKENNPKLFPAVGFYNKGQRNVNKCLSDNEFELLREKLKNDR